MAATPVPLVRRISCGVGDGMRSVKSAMVTLSMPRVPYRSKRIALPPLIMSQVSVWACSTLAPLYQVKSIVGVIVYMAKQVGLEYLLMPPLSRIAVVHLMVSAKSASVRAIRVPSNPEMSGVGDLTVKVN